MNCASRFATTWLSRARPRPVGTPGQVAPLDIAAAALWMHTLYVVIIAVGLFLRSSESLGFENARNLSILFLQTLAGFTSIILSTDFSNLAGSLLGNTAGGVFSTSTAVTLALAANIFGTWRLVYLTGGARVSPFSGALAMHILARDWRSGGRLRVAGSAPRTAGGVIRQPRERNNAGVKAWWAARQAPPDTLD
jgi:hypothetical protein